MEICHRDDIFIVMNGRFRPKVDWFSFLENVKGWPPKKWIAIAFGIFLVGLLFLFSCWMLGFINLGSSGGSTGANFSNFGPIGDYFGGMMAPFIGLIGALLTFAAFYVQYEANQKQQEAINEQKAELTKQADEIQKQENRRKAEAFEQRFFEMLRIHRENSQSMHLTVDCFTKLGDTPDWKLHSVFTSQEVVKLIITEFEYVYSLIGTLIDRKLVVEKDPFDVANLAYGFVFSGWHFETIGGIPLPANWISKENPNSSTFVTGCLGTFIQRKPSSGLPIDLARNILTTGPVNRHKHRLLPKMLQGYSQQLSAYFRHLFQMVKQLDELDSEILDDVKKIQLAKTLRAQLTNEDQLLLYYNSLWSVGKVWWENGYMTKYKFIKHVPIHRVPKEISPVRRMRDHLKETDYKKLQQYFDIELDQSMVD